jgi:TRAP-type transport system small permease protein
VKSIFKLVNSLLNGLIVISFISLVMIVSLQVFFRYVVGDSLIWAEEVARFIFIWLIYLGGIITVRKGMNITFDVLLEHLPNKLWLMVFSAINLISAGFLFLVIILGFDLANQNMTQLSSAIRFPMGIVYLAIPVGAVGMLITQIQWYRETVQKRRAEQEC